MEDQCAQLVRDLGVGCDLTESTVEQLREGIRKKITDDED